MVVAARLQSPLKTGGGHPAAGGSQLGAPRRRSAGTASCTTSHRGIHITGRVLGMHQSNYAL